MFKATLHDVTYFTDNHGNEFAEATFRPENDEHTSDPFTPFTVRVSLENAELLRTKFGQSLTFNLG